MRRTLVAIWLHALLISRRSIMLLIGIYLIAATFGWIGIGLLIAYTIMPPPIGWGWP